MKNKRGQFFLIAAFFIIVILFGITGLSTYTIIKPEPQTIFDVSSELNRESYHIIEYGVYNEKDLTSLTEHYLDQDVAKYFLRKSNDANIVFVYGDKDGLKALYYKDTIIGTITIAGAGAPIDGTFSESFDITINPGDKDVKVRVDGKDYFFELKDNEMFYFLIILKRGEEKFVERN